MSTSFDIVAKLWNLCNVLRDDGVQYSSYVTELTYLLFLKMSDVLNMAQSERLQKLNRIAIVQMEILTSEHSRKLPGGGNAG